MRVLVQSSGRGVNSVSLSKVIGYKALIAFADTGGEMPETYEYIDYYNKIHPIKIIKTPVNGTKENLGKPFYSLEEYCLAHKTPPMKKFRWCTDRFKTHRLEEYYKTLGDGEIRVFIGYAYDERHRIKVYERGRFIYEYPLVDQGITREKCIEIIKEAGLRIPPKSGCFFCPFQRKASWIRLMRNHPDLYDRAVIMDKLTPRVRLCYGGLSRLRGRIVKGMEQTSLVEEDEGWECNFCMVVK
jgi:3'-phosphoadenosine 5'-phosphosulfate sulfotransferase (PAPS reductase)/FAD synthetase